jgi:hypothetical protein
VCELLIAIPVDIGKEVCPGDDIGLFGIDVIVESLGEVAEVAPLVAEADVTDVA